MKKNKNEFSNSEHKKGTANYYFKEETPGIKSCGFGYKEIMFLYPGMRYDMTNLRLENNQVYTFELWDEQGYIGTYWVLRTIFERNTQKNIQNYPDVGSRRSGLNNLNDKPKKRFQLPKLEDIPEKLDSDFSVYPFEGNDARISIEENEIFCEDIMEGLFLYLLLEYAKNDGNSSLHISNYFFGTMVPPYLAIIGWIQNSLEKFSSLGILEVSEYDLKSTPYTEIKIKLPVSYILFSSKEKLSV